MIFLKKLWARNDDSHAEIVLPFVVLTLFMGFILTGTAIVLATQNEQKVTFGIISGLAVVSWASLAILMRKYSRISM